MSRASIGDYVVTSKLGSGSFAVVYKGYHKVSKVPVAIKALSLNKLNGKLLANLEMEISIMRQIDHPNVVKLYEIKKTEKHMYLMLEYCAGGDLQQYMRRRQSAGHQLLEEETARHFLRELAKGMQCLWQHNLIHRDLKPQNLLLVEDSPASALKIADFGFARHLATASMAETLCGSPLYMAPEILKFQKYDAKADLWSVGTILFEMLAGRPPYGGANHVQLLANIERQPLRFPPTLQLSRACRQLLVGLLQRKPALRLGFAEFFADPFVDLQPLPELQDEAEAARRSTTTSIREEEEEDDEPAGHWGVSTGGSSRAKSGTEDAAVPPSPGVRRGSGSERERRLRAFSVSHEGSSSRFASTAPSGTMRQSRSGNLEVMETAFASASSGSSALRRSSRLARSRRATSSGSGFAPAAGASGTSPKLSPQMSPHILPSPSPSPRINPFKQLSESPPGAAALQQHSSLSASSRSKSAATSPPVPNDAIVSSRPKATGGGHALDSSGEYVLVDELSEKTSSNGAALSAARLDAAAGSGAGVLHDGPVAPDAASSGEKTSISREYGQQLIDIVVLRTQAISPIADQLWTLSAAGDVPLDSGSETAGPSGEDWPDRSQTPAEGSPDTSEVKAAGGVNFSSVFSMSSSLASSVGAGNALGDDYEEDEDEDDDDNRAAERQYVCAGEALALYVKCLRLVQHVIIYLRRDAAYTGAASPGIAPGVSETSRKVSMAFLMEQLTHFLDRADQCKARMARVSRRHKPSRTIASQEELLYAHALRLGRQGAIREVLGHIRAAHDHYLQALLLLESLLMETPGANAGVGALAVDDQKSVNTFLRALEQRLKNVRASLENEESADTSASYRRRMQHPPRPPHQLTYYLPTTPAVL